MKYLIKILLIINVLLLLNKCLVEAQCSTDCQTLQSIKPVIKYLTNTLNTKYPPVQCSIQCPNSINYHNINQKPLQKHIQLIVTI